MITKTCLQGSQGLDRLVSLHAVDHWNLMSMSRAVAWFSETAILYGAFASAF